MVFPGTGECVLYFCYLSFSGMSKVVYRAAMMRMVATEDGPLPAAASFLEGVLEKAVA